jgi:hypothetical protein
MGARRRLVALFVAVATLCLAPAGLEVVDLRLRCWLRALPVAVRALARPQGAIRSRSTG